MFSDREFTGFSEKKYLDTCLLHVFSPVSGRPLVSSWDSVNKFQIEKHVFRYV